MSGYSHVLIAVDLSDDSDAVVHRGLEVARRFNARATVLHVVEFIPVDPAGEALLPPPMDLENELVQGAKRRLEDLCGSLNIKDLPHRVVTGVIKAELLRTVMEEHIDLIVLGSHERHGLALLLGSTEKSILHRASCDVLAVRLH
ncbi:MAG TPA: universal stress protein [Gammaproteobacteria bacterium]|nr:universal stress protein [Gammaproteobacteria bacterium]